MSRFIPLLLCLALSAPLVSWAQVKLDIIPLKHRTTDQVLPALQPLVGEDAALSGANNRIFIRAVETKTMPLGNLTGMTDAERAVLGRWIAQGAPVAGGH